LRKKTIRFQEPQSWQKLVMSMSNNDNSIPVVQGETLLYLSDEQDNQVQVGTPAWYAWLRTANRFAFRSAFGTFTARKERAGNQRGEWYWRAYRKRGGKLYRAYLGHSAALTSAHLHVIAAKLTARQEEVGGEPLLYTLQERSPEPQRLSLLPVQLTSFVGREQEIASISRLLLRDDVRLLTLTGPGGVGKTRVALAVAERVQKYFRDGVCLVSLAPITEAELVLPTIAGTLGVKATRTQVQEERLLHSLRDRQLLLLLDNFEQLISVASRLLELLVACPAVKLLVTSRAVLHLRGEQVFPVPPLALPDPTPLSEGALLPSSSAVTLFYQRAQEVSPAFQLTPENALAVAEVCRRLDGLPLALELAAARIKLFPPHALLVRLQQGRHLLTSNVHDVPARQQTLQQTIKWSYDLLDDQEQALFRHLSIFVGGCTLEAAEAVCQALGEAERDMLDLVSSLLDKSLLHQVAGGQDAPRLQLLETIRAFGLERLVEAGESGAAGQAHAHYFLRVAEVAEPELYGASQVARFDTLQREHDNFRAALRWLLETRASEQALGLCVALARFWTIRSYVTEGRAWLRGALELAAQVSQATTIRAKALCWAGWLAQLQGELTVAAALCQESLDLSRHLSDQHTMALALSRLGIISSSQGDDTTACSLLEESVKQYQTLADESGLAYALMALGAMAIGHREPGEVRAWLEESLALFQTLKNEEGIAWSLYSLARLSLLLADFEHASLFSQEALLMFRTLGLVEGKGSTLFLLGQVYLSQEETSLAGSRFTESRQLFQEVGNRQGVAYTLFSLACVAVLQGSREAARRYWDEGLALLRALHDTPGMVMALETLATVAAQQQEARWAAQLWGAAEALCETAQFAMSSTERAAFERNVAATRIQLDSTAFTTAWSFGRTLTPDQAFTVRDRPPARLTPGLADDLSSREVEVLRLLAQGLTNAQIAERLVISPCTVNAHLRSIYNKLAVTSRTAATRYALAHQLI
jgi:predicted ATPase/DNA-binding CsgD family transcriptional regulator